MKRNSLFSSLSLLMALTTIVFFACKKNVNTDAQSSGTVSNASVRPVTAPYTTISFNPDPGVVGQDFTASVALDPVPDCGKVQLQQKQLADGTPTYKDDINGTWVTVAEASAPFNGLLPLTYTYVPQTGGLVGYRAHYEPTGGQCGYTGRPAVSVNATIGEGCTEGLFPQLAGAIPISTDAKGTTWQFTVKYVLNTCSNGYIGKLQGGLIAKSTLVSVSPANYTVSSTAKSNVITWSNVSDGVYSITYQVKLAPGESPVTGEWSFKKGGTLIYGYTDRVLFSF